MMYCDCKRTDTHMWCDGRAYRIDGVNCYFDWKVKERSKKEQTNMTRQEAIKKVDAVTGHMARASDIVNGIEALGLIKFEEEKKSLSAKEIIESQGYNADRLLKQLSEHGYRIVKIGQRGLKFNDADGKDYTIRDPFKEQS